jgi:hypothetical protein
MRLSRSGVLECQDRPITRRSAITQLIYLLACLCQRHCFLICISNERNCVIIIFVQTQRAWIAISAETKSEKLKRMNREIFCVCFRKFFSRAQEELKSKHVKDYREIHRDDSFVRTNELTVIIMSWLKWFRGKRESRGSAPHQTKNLFFNSNRPQRNLEQT